MLLLGMHNTVAFILIMIFILPFVMSNTAMKINLQTYNGDNFVCTKICFGSLPQCFNLQLDFQSFFTWIYLCRIFSRIRNKMGKWLHKWTWSMWFTKNFNPFYCGCWNILRFWYWICHSKILFPFLNKAGYWVL